MARKPQVAGESTRERILAAALPLFAEHGYAGTSTRMVAGAADVNVATLAYYFEGKEGLYGAVCERLHEDLAEAAPPVPPDVPVEDLHRWVADLAWSFAREHRIHIRLLLRNVLDSGRHADVVMTRWSDELLDRADRIVQVFRPDWDRVRRRLTVLGLMHTIARLAIEDEAQLGQMAGHPDDLDEAIRAFLADHLALLLGAERP